MHTIHVLLFILICAVTCGIVIYAKKEKTETCPTVCSKVQEPTQTNTIQPVLLDCNSYQRNYLPLPPSMYTYIVKPHAHGYQMDDRYGPSGPIYPIRH